MVRAYGYDEKGWEVMKSKEVTTVAEAKAIAEAWLLTKTITGKTYKDIGYTYKIVGEEVKPVIPAYPKNIVRGKYSLWAYDLAGERFLKDFLGIEPPGVDIDTYLSTLTATKLKEWRDYWVGLTGKALKFDISALVEEKYNEYMAKLKVVVLKTAEEIEEEEARKEAPEFMSVWDRLKEAIKTGDITKIHPSLSMLYRTGITKDLYYSDVPITPAGGFVLAGVPKLSAFITKNWKKLLAGATAIMGTVTFINFLYEEMLQTVGMGTWVAISNKQWSIARKNLEKAKSLLSHAEFIYNNFGWLSPFTWDVFKRYAEGTRLQYQTFEEVINKNLPNLENPTAKGKVFDKDTALNNISKGITPNVTDLVTSVTPEYKLVPIEEVKVEVTPEVKKEKKVYIAKGKYGFSVDTTPDGAIVEYCNRKRKYVADKTYVTSVQNGIVEVKMEGYKSLSFQVNLIEKDTKFYKVDLISQTIEEVFY